MLAPVSIRFVAILDEGEGVACQILAQRGVDLTELSSALTETDNGR
jgi:hypothetical protein